MEKETPGKEHEKLAHGKSHRLMRMAQEKCSFATIEVSELACMQCAAVRLHAIQHSTLSSQYLGLIEDDCCGDKQDIGASHPHVQHWKTERNHYRTKRHKTILVE